MLVETKKEKLARKQRERRVIYKRNGHVDPYTLKYKYGISLETLQEMKQSQQELCAICKSPFKTLLNTIVDHCHTTGKVRGLLCRKCNVGLGMFEDNKSKLLEAIEYLNGFG